MTRSFVLAAVVLALAGFAAPAAAEPATPGPSSPVASYPEVRIRATDQGFEVPTRVEAGRVLITLENASARDALMVLIQLPAGATIADLQATPAPGQQGPALFYRVVMPGAPALTPAGGREQAVVDLAPGQYVAVGERGEFPTPFEVVEGPSATPAPEPEAAGTVTMKEFSFELPTALAPGRQLWKVVNAGQQPHQLILYRLPASATMEQVQEVLGRADAATPPPGGLTEADFVASGGLEVLSAGRTAWSVLDLAPGRYVALCFVPDRQTGMPHASEGMVALFDVGA